MVGTTVGDTGAYVEAPAPAGFGDVRHHRDMDEEVEVDNPEDDEIDRQYVEGQPLRFRFSWRKLWRFVRCTERFDPPALARAASAPA